VERHTVFQTSNNLATDNLTGSSPFTVFYAAGTLSEPCGCSSFVEFDFEFEFQVDPNRNLINDSRQQ